MSLNDMAAVKGCCRLDYRFEVVGFTLRGVNIWREDFEKFIINQYIAPNETIQVDCLQLAVQTAFCCCENGCAIF